jgi:hypothetical protein
VASWMARLKSAQAVEAALSEPEDPWLAPLSRVKGKIDYFDTMERVSTQRLLDHLQVPQGKRRTAYRRLSRLMVQLGWSPVRVRDTTCGGYKEQVRGFCRDPRQTPLPVWGASA